MPIHGYPGNVITANPTAPTSSVATGVWTTEQQLLAQAAGNWPFTIPTQQISRSLRFNRPDSAYLNRTFSTGNRKTWTWSCWIKRSTLDVGGGDVPLISSAGASSTYDSIRFNSDSTFRIYYSGGAAYSVAISGSPVFRDVSAWYHIVVAQDTTQATESLRLRVWINGVQQTLTGIPAQNYESGFNSGVQHEIGKQYIQSEYFPGYMAEAYFIGGSALTPSSFGQTNASTGVWEPIAYTGSYSGTNSFYLNFSDNSGTTSTTLGKDYSGNGNNWTPNNFSVTAGAGNDSLVDSPTSYGTDTGVGGEVRGNYCTFNPLNANSAITLSNGNLTITQSNNRFCGTTIPVASGKWYFEYLPANTGTGNSGIGVIRASDNVFGSDAFSAAGSYAGVGYLSSGNKNVSGTITSYGATYVSGDVIGVAIDLDSGTQTITFYKNNTSQGSINIPTASQTWMVVCDGATSVSANINFGQRAFAYTAPSGFKALCTQNLPTPTIGATSTTQANQYFDVELWTGNGTTQNITTANFQPDWLWVKERSEARSNLVWDAVRGSNLGLLTNSTNAESSQPSFTGFLSNGFGVSNTDASDITNKNAQTYVGWIWKANGAGSSNTAGSITSTVSANTTSGFSIVTYTGTGSNATVGHGLGVAPQMVIVKCRNNAGQWWPVWHTSLTSGAYALALQRTDGQASYPTMFNSTVPTSTVFSVGTSGDTNGNTFTYVAYCFAAVAGYSAFGSYTGNGSADGPFVFLNFRPRYVLIKRTDAAENWYVKDTARDPYNPTLNILIPNSSSAEIGNQQNTDFISNGFKIRTTDGAINASGGTYIYMAFAESPFKYALAR